MTSHTHCGHWFELAAGALLIAASVMICLVMDSCGSAACRAGGGQWVSGQANGGYVSFCIEKEVH